MVAKKETKAKKSTTKEGYKLADKIQGAKPTPYMKKMRKEMDSRMKSHDKEHAKYLKERSARYKREGITE